MEALHGITLTLVGAGKMGGAMLEGWLSQGVPARAVTVVDPFIAPETAESWAGAGVSINPAAPAPADVLVIAVKPQVMAGVLEGLASHAGPDTLIISVAAGCRVAQFEATFGSGAAIARVMPNTPAAIGRGMMVCFANGAASAAQRELCSALMAAVGEVAWIDDEAQMDAVTALSGSGPAYVFHLVEAMTEAGVAAGLPEETARLLARTTVEGAGELLHQSEESAAQLRINVTSPKGTTAAALDVLMGEGGLSPLMARAIAAAKARSEALARGE